MRIHRTSHPGLALAAHDIVVDPARTTGPSTAVLIHGLGSAGMASFSCLLPFLMGATDRILIVDLPGHGLSDRPVDFSYSMEAQAAILGELLDEVRITGTLLVGHSMGGAIAIRIAHTRPDLVSRLVVAEGNLDPDPGFVSGPITATDEDTFVRAGWHALAGQIEENGYAEYAATFRIASPIALHRCATSLTADRVPTFRQQLENAPVPRVFVFGDRTLPDPDADRLPGAGIDVRIVRNAGHDMMNDNPAVFAEILTADP